VALLALPAIVPPVAKILTTGFSAAKAVEKLASKIKASVKNTEILFLNIKSPLLKINEAGFSNRNKPQYLCITLPYRCSNFNGLFPIHSKVIKFKNFNVTFLAAQQSYHGSEKQKSYIFRNPVIKTFGSS
jgi:hypothetical protein